jgi:DNA-binding MarR family transcriptional regulator
MKDMNHPQWRGGKLLNGFNRINDTDFIFGALLVAANKTDTLLDRVLCKYGITSKQWLLLLVIFNLFKEPPTIKEAAEEMGSSHQNVKQVALKLQEKGFLQMKKDQNDKRATRLIPTEHSYALWKKTENDGKAFMEAFYKGIDRENLVHTRRTLDQIMSNLNVMEEDPCDINISKERI